MPESVWHRSLSKRRLPPKALSKAVLVAVVACTADKRLHDEDIVASTKVWIGLLDPQMEKVDYIEGLQFDHHFGLVGDLLALPYGKALVEVANEHFGFERMQKLEESLEAIRGSLASLAGGTHGGARAVPLPVKKENKKNKGPASGVAGMDPTTVHESHLEEMSKILRSRPQRLEDVPRKGVLKKAPTGGPLGETEDEGDGEPELIPDVNGSADPRGPATLETAVIQLAAIAKKLTEEDTRKDRIDQILDGGGGSGSHGEGTSLPTSRKNSVALRALQKCLREDPRYIYIRQWKPTFKETSWEGLQRPESRECQAQR